MKPLERAASNVVHKCLRVQPADRVVLITDQSTQRIAEAVHSKVNSIGAQVLRINLDEYGSRPLTGFPPQMRRQIVRFKPTVSWFAAAAGEGELPNLRRPLGKLLRENLRTRHAHSPALTEEVLLRGMRTDYDRIAALTHAVHSIVRHARRIQVRTPAGTNLDIELNPRRRWKLSTGFIHQQGGWSNLPDGELYTAPWNVNGTLVVDGCLGDWFKKYGEIHNSPVTITVRNGRALLRSIHCANGEIEQNLRTYLKQHPNSNRVGELGIGTNFELTDLIGNLLLDEKFPGIHVAFGDPYAHHTGAKWSAPSHIDGVLRRCTIVVDGRKIMKNGTFAPELLRATQIKR